MEIADRERVLNKKTEYKIYALIFICAFFGLSNNVTNFIFSKIGMPFYLFEIFLIPLLMRRKVKEYLAINLSIAFVLLMLWMTYSFLCGIINVGDAVGVLTCGRSMLYLVLLSFYGPKLIKTDYVMDKMFWLSTGALVGDIIFVFMNSGTLSDKGYIHINILAVAFCVIIPFITRKKTHAIFGITGAVIAAFFSGYRINMLVLLVALLLGGLYFIKNSKTVVKVVCILVYICICYAVLTNYMQLIANVSEFLNLPEHTVYRLLERTEGLGSGNLSYSDKQRITQYKEEVPELIKQVMPQGPIRKSISAKQFGMYTDVPVTYLVDMFGSIVAIILILYVLIKGLWLMAKVMIEKNLSDMMAFAGLCVPILICLFVINGTMFSFTNIAVMAGIPIGYIISGQGVIK